MSFVAMTNDTYILLERARKTPKFRAKSDCLTWVLSSIMLLLKNKTSKIKALLPHNSCVLSLINLILLQTGDICT